MSGQIVKRTELYKGSAPPSQVDLGASARIGFVARERAQAREEAARVLEEARREADELIDQARESAGQIQRDARKAGQTEAAEEVARTLGDFRRRREEQLAGIGESALRFAFEIARRILGRELRREPTA